MYCMDCPVNPVQSDRSNSRKFGQIDTKDATSKNEFFEEIAD